jgi:hypothetical protein
MDTTEHTTDTTSDLHEVALLRSRAGSLRHQAEHLDDVLATTYRRRASELEMEAWILEVQAGVPADQVHPAA